MILNHYYNIIISLIFLSTIIGSSIEPLETNRKEELIINNNNRDYYLLYKESLHYNINGPIRLEVIARRAIPRESTKKYNYGYIVSLDNTGNNHIVHNKRKLDSIISPAHPGHGYTQAGNCIIIIPEGDHLLTLEPIKRGKPILIRLLDKKLKKLDGITIQPKITNFLDPIEFLINEKKRNYYEISKENNIEIETFGKGTLVVYTRRKFNIVQKLDSYQIEIYENGKSKDKLIEFSIGNEFNKNKSRIIQYNLDQDSTHYSFKLINNSSSIYLRLLQYIPYE